MNHNYSKMYVVYFWTQNVYNLHTFEFWIHSTISKRINSLVDLCFYGGKIFWFFFTCRVLLLYTSVFFGTNFHLSNVVSRYVVLDIRPNYRVLLDRKRWMCLMSRSGPWHQGLTPMAKPLLCPLDEDLPTMM